ncbi:AbrB/MazE/SpoVT family DNA-binding domain-containing protein [Candidatus Woesearchaeota archaeon]|nr:AbrB/MazE/SpoVT family DNA-binding domain-containing protein [Candidatus Woesearchaeota archaeon]
MVKITFTGKQYVVTIPKDMVDLMGWDKSTEVIISKYPDKDFLFVEQIKKRKSQ